VIKPVILKVWFQEQQQQPWELARNANSQAKVRLSELETGGGAPQIVFKQLF
jgi:hypothetical protein